MCTFIVMELGLVLRDSHENNCSNQKSKAGFLLVHSKPSIERSTKAVSWDTESPLTVAVGSRVEIINGSSVTLICNSSGFPLPKLTWTRGIEAIPVDDEYEIGEQALTISNVQLADAGEYTCTATNQAGQDAATTELVVKGASFHVGVLSFFLLAYFIPNSIWTGKRVETTT